MQSFELFHEWSDVVDQEPAGYLWLHDNQRVICGQVVKTELVGGDRLVRITMDSPIRSPIVRDDPLHTLLEGWRPAPESERSITFPNHQTYLIENDQRCGKYVRFVGTKGRNRLLFEARKDVVIALCELSGLLVKKKKELGPVHQLEIMYQVVPTLLQVSLPAPGEPLEPVLAGWIDALLVVLHRSWIPKDQALQLAKDLEGLGAILESAGDSSLANFARNVVSALKHRE